MTGTDFIVIAIVLVIIGLAIGYIVKAKKGGAKCIGCPSGCCCSAKNGTVSSCECASEGKNGK